MLYKEKYLTALIEFDLQKIQWTLSKDRPSIFINVSMNKAETAIDTVIFGAGSPKYKLVRAIELGIDQDTAKVAADTYHFLSVQNIKDKVSEIKKNGGVSKEMFEIKKKDVIEAYVDIGIADLIINFGIHLSKNDLCEFIMDEISKRVSGVYLLYSSVQNGVLALSVGVLNDTGCREIELKLPFSINFKSSPRE